MAGDPLLESKSVGSVGKSESSIKESIEWLFCCRDDDHEVLRGTFIGGGAEWAIKDISLIAVAGQVTDSSRTRRSNDVRLLANCRIF